MTVLVTDIAAILEDFAPGRLAESWDNSGLQVGAMAWPVKHIQVALDPLPEVVLQACRKGVDMLITHHPLMLKPISAIDADTPLGRTIAAALTHRLTLYAMHTNLDKANGGLNDMLAGVLRMTDVQAFVGSQTGMCSNGQGQELPEGLGRIGDLKEEITLAELGQALKTGLGLTSLRMAGDPELSVKRIAVCTGSGGSLIGAFLASDAQVYVSGDLRYHEARDVEAAGRALVDVGHFASEHLMVASLTRRLEERLNQMGWALTIEACGIETDPFHVI